MRKVLFWIGWMMVWGGLPLMAATVELVDGTTRSGRVIVRKDIVTIRSVDAHGRVQLYQFPASGVRRIQGDSKAPNLIARGTALRAGDSRLAEPLFELEKGLQVERQAARPGWVQVRGWNDKVSGYVLATDLASEVVFTPGERREAKLRLGLPEIPPPPEVTRLEEIRQAPPLNSEEDGSETAAETTESASRETDASLTE